MYGLRPLALCLLCVVHLITLAAGDSNSTIIVPTDIPACQIYCFGPLLHTVQMAHLYKDSKTFVDMKLKMTINETLDNFSLFMAENNDQPSVDQIREFVNDHFDDIGKEFSDWLPSDWKENPDFLKQITDPDLKEWGSDLNIIWKELGRKMIADVHTNPEQYSIIPVDNGVIVPGGRFIEFYYWDSYWIIRGLLYSEMYDTARGMLENFKSILQRYGFIPNGGRIYYSTRSQPPFFTGMVKSYVDFTKDEQFAIDALEMLEHEFEYWINYHMIQVSGHDVFVYGGNSLGPRPESYSEDVETAQIFATDEEKEAHYSELKAAAESSMDFSSRWFINEQGTKEGNLTHLKTRSIVPVDLNTILYWNAKIIAEFYAKAGNESKSIEYEAKAEAILEAIGAIHWNETVGAWLDYDIINNKHRDYFVPTNLMPLWMNAYNLSDSTRIAELVLNYIEKQDLDKYPGGVPNTLYRTGEQWDFPNVWAPMTYTLIEGLESLGTAETKKLAKKWATRWVTSNYKAYNDTKAMFEKYDAEKFGGHGGGGEYDVQKGFGWSNGVIIEYLAKYGRDISLKNGVSAKDLFSLLLVASIAFVTTIVGRLI